MPVATFERLDAKLGDVGIVLAALNFNDLLSSYSVGLSLRAGGAPMITASYGWNGDGHRFIVNMESSLLGGSLRPSLH